MIQRQRAQAIRRFPVTWAGMVRQWNQPGAQDGAWLMYSANYLLRTANVRWAMDPVRLEHRLAGAAPVEYAASLAALSFVALTHEHSDHLDLPLIRSLSHLPIVWIVPEPISRQVIDQGGIPASSVITPRHLQPVEIHGIRLTPFDGMHWEKEPHAGGERLRGVPALGYLVEFSGKRWLFPGDTRTYDASLLPAFGPVDGLFAHVWLGRGAAAQADPPLLEAFSRFCLDLQPRRIVLAHLREFSREQDEYWDQRHAELVRDRLHELRPDVPVRIALMGEAVSL